MTVGIQLGQIVDEIGAPSFLNAYFSTVAGLLEKGKPGSRYPVISLELYGGTVKVAHLAKGLSELRSIRAEFAKHPPSSVIWDIEHPSITPPWGAHISPTITSMANYFVSSTGRDLFDIFEEVFAHAIKTNRDVQLVEI